MLTATIRFTDKTNPHASVVAQDSCPKGTEGWIDGWIDKFQTFLGDDWEFDWDSFRITDTDTVAVEGTGLSIARCLANIDTEEVIA